jgi:predicted PurR-regulated permease PerM
VDSGPVYGALFWAAVLAILFAPLYRRLCGSMGQRRTAAALSTLVIILLIVILPSALVTAMLVQEAIGVYGRIQSGELDLGRGLQQVLAVLPSWLTGLLERVGVTDVRSLRDRLAGGLMKGIQLIRAGVECRAEHPRLRGEHVLDAVRVVLSPPRWSRAVRPHQTGNAAGQRVWQGLVLIGFGVLVIGLVDNVLRPFVVGKDIKMPDYVVLISTLGGMATFGFNGFVIGPVIAAMFMAVWDTIATSRAQVRPDRALD